MRWVVRILAAAFVLAAGMGQAQAPAQKLALVIGVSDYARTLTPEEETAGFLVPKSLPNAVRDAGLVADAFAAQGFAVTRLADPDKRAMLTALANFSTALTRAGPDAVGVFYFAGHGAQGRPALERDIDNYLIPRNTALITEVDLESEALALSRVSATLRPGPRGATVLILDACRDFALPAANRSGAVTRGLAEARAAPGTMIAYATSPGATALDGPAGGNGPYARALASEIRGAQGATLEQVFISVRNKVLAETRETQLPWENSSLRRSVTLGVAPASVASVDEKTFWDDCCATQDASPDALQEYIDRVNAREFPGTYVARANLGLQAMRPEDGSVPDTAKDAYFVIDTTTGEMVRAQNEDEPRFPASLTKVMTVYVLFQEIKAGRLRMDTEIEVTRPAAAQPPARLGLRIGDRISLAQAIDAMNVSSSNDVAVAAAIKVSGTEAEFVRRMNAEAAALGMRNTVFTNASGLPSAQSRTTARDMALLGTALLQRFPEYYPLFSRDSFAYGKRVFRSHNRLLGMLEGVDGIQSGYTRASGFNILGSGQRRGHRIVVAVFGGRTSAERDWLLTNLFEAAFSTVP